MRWRMPTRSRYLPHPQAERGAEHGFNWEANTKGLLRAEMVKRGVSYVGLVEKLGTLGIRETEANIHNKIGRGGFSGAFLIQCLVAMGVTSLRLEA